MKTLDKMFCWIENNTNTFVTIAFGLVWAVTINLAWEVLKK
jgi:hypothetical protein